LIEKKNNWKKYVKWTSLIILLFLLVWLFFDYQGIELDTNSYGHGSSLKTGATSFFQSLGIMEDFDYVDEDTGEGYCFDDVCWINAQIEYESCLDDVGLVELSPSGIESFINYMDVMPSAYALAPELPEDDEDICNDNYIATLTSDCSRNCEEETYTWDGIPVTNLDTFTQTAFPNFYEMSQSKCEFFIFGGTWLSQADKIGCTDMGWFGDWMCETRSHVSAKEVCNQIGKSWSCQDGEIVCKN